MQFDSCKKLYWVLFFNFMQTFPFFQCSKTPKIAIVGAGIGGASSAHFLRELFGPNGAKIHVYEANEIGGRLSTALINRMQYETGGSIIHGKNRYMLKFMDLCGLKKKESKESTLGLYDGNSMVFQTSESSFVTYLKLFWRYGFNPLRLDKIVNSVLERFERIYHLQDEGVTFHTVHELLSAMSPELVALGNRSIFDELQQQSINDLTIEELVEACLRVNYGQDTGVQSFVGMVSLAGMDNDVFSIKGGNKQVPKILLDQADVTMIKGYVHTITASNMVFDENMAYLVNYTLNEPREGGRVEGAEFYDVVIVAAPQTTDMKYRIQFRNFNTSFNFTGRYHLTVCTLVHGEINKKFFGDDYSVGDVITINNKTMFNSISAIASVDGVTSGNVWKVFSQEPLREDQMDEMFSKINEITSIKWLAYPHYEQLDRNDRFDLDRGLFHVSAIEWAASAMEMSAISGRNCALLAYKMWMKRNGVDFDHFREKMLTKNNYFVDEKNEL